MLLLTLLLCSVPLSTPADLIGGQEAIQLLGLAAAELPTPFALEAPRTSQRQQLRALLLRDADLRVSKSGRQLVYNCRHLAKHLPNSTQRAQLEQDHRGGPRRQLLQLLRPSLEDPAPASLKRAKSGLPLLHRFGTWQPRKQA